MKIFVFDTVENMARKRGNAGYSRLFKVGIVRSDSVGCKTKIDYKSLSK